MPGSAHLGSGLLRRAALRYALNIHPRARHAQPRKAPVRHTRLRLQATAYALCCLR